MTNRREFLQAGTAALLWGSRSGLGLAHAAKSKVVVARDVALHAAGPQPDEKRVQDLLDRAIASYTGRDEPVAAWRRIVPVGKVIGLKINTMGGKPIATHLALVLAVAERLQQAGVKPGEILVWEARTQELEHAGYTINTDPSRIRCYGTDRVGYEEAPAAFGSTSNVNLSKILTRECDMVINLPVLKDHGLVGVTFSMKNMYGAVQRPSELHAGGCNPGVANLNCIPVVRQKVRFTIGDATSSLYDGGAKFHPEFLWQPNAIIVGADRVAVDYTGWQIMERKRAEMKMPTLQAAGRYPSYIAAGADSVHQLGVNDPKHISLVEI